MEDNKLSSKPLLCCCICFPASATVAIILNGKIKGINGDNMVRGVGSLHDLVLQQINTQSICNTRSRHRSSGRQKSSLNDIYIKHFQRAGEAVSQTCWNLQWNELKGKRCCFGKWCLCVMQMKSPARKGEKRKEKALDDSARWSGLVPNAQY